MNKMCFYVGENRYVEDDYEVFVQVPNGILLSVVDGEYISPNNWILHGPLVSVEITLAIVEDLEIGGGDGDNN